jgi:hypothetical protein
MIIALYIAAAVIDAVASLYFAWRYREFRKFLAGAFFVSSGILFYLYLADVSVPLLGTNIVATPQSSGGRSIVHFILFLLCFYFGFVRKPKAWNEGHPRDYGRNNSALTPAETERLFKIARTLRDHSKSVLLITHRLEEVEAIADDITILRDGYHVATRRASEINRVTLVQMMVGRPIETLFEKRNATRAILVADQLPTARQPLNGDISQATLSLIESLSWAPVVASNS